MNRISLFLDIQSFFLSLFIVLLFFLYKEEFSHCSQLKRYWHYKFITRWSISKLPSVKYSIHSLINNSYASTNFLSNRRICSRGMFNYSIIVAISCCRLRHIGDIINSAFLFQELDTGWKRQIRYVPTTQTELTRRTRALVFFSLRSPPWAGWFPRRKAIAKCIVIFRCPCLRAHTQRTSAFSVGKND